MGTVEMEFAMLVDAGRRGEALFEAARTRLAAADDAIMLKRVIKGVAAAHAAGMRCAALTSSPAYTGGADVELARLADLRL